MRNIKSIIWNNKLIKLNLNNQHYKSMIELANKEDTFLNQKIC